MLLRSFTIRQFSQKQPEWLSLYHNLEDISQFTKPNALSLLKNYYKLIKLNREENIINLSSDPLFINSLDNLSKLVPQFSITELTLLCQTISQVTYSHKIWESVENSLIKGKIKEINPKEISIIMNTMSRSNRKNQQLWKEFEDLTLSMLPLYNFEASRIVEFYCCFRFSQSGSASLFDQLILRIIQVSQINPRCVENLSSALLLEDQSNPRLLQLLAESGVKCVPEIKGYQLSFLLSVLAKNRWDSESISNIEFIINPLLKECNQYNISKICQSYGVYLFDKISKPGPRQSFLLSVEKFLNTQKRNYVFAGNHLLAFKIMWGLSRSGVVGEKGLWTEYCQLLSKQQIPGSGLIKEDFLEDMKKRNLA